MHYTWGYIKENALSKLNLDEEAANQQGFLSRFPYQANEAMTQICSAIKPNYKTFEVEVFDKKTMWRLLYEKHGISCEEEPNIDDDDYEIKLAFWNEWKTLSFVNETITFPSDFIAFSDDVAEYKSTEPNHYCHYHFTEASDEQLNYHGYNQIICKRQGIYRIPYKARWFFFTKELQNSVKIPAPVDVLDCIPSYIASQCFKIDDEQKSSIYRNEYEMFLARIDDTYFKSQRTFTIGGNW